eukprot:TRINITY_DN28011_c0_g1_i1.p3 TRINITY_DN28011_c0_g1~~TRINITY_DN28011_c0_g1_i1.p3  ORF type:complete len:100 (+),score=7.56 TRINITY_DN28011_c0_g1_i1:110-409(+)
MRGSSHSATLNEAALRAVAIARFWTKANRRFKKLKTMICKGRDQMISPAWEQSCHAFILPCRRGEGLRPAATMRAKSWIAANAKQHHASADVRLLTRPM